MSDRLKRRKISTSRTTKTEQLLRHVLLKQSDNMWHNNRILV